jgi:SAM-dependent methyltransferase
MAAMAPSFLCPNGCGSLALQLALSCAECGRTLELDGPYLDFMETEPSSPSGVGPRLMHSALLARVYESFWRPMFVSVLGAKRADLNREFRRVRRGLEPAMGDWISDLSCGPGVMGRRLADCGAYQGVIGLDLSHVMLMQAATHAAVEGTRDFQLIRADITHQPFLDDSLGGAHAGAALHLWPDVPGALKETARTLRPGGAFVASTFFASHRPLVSVGQRLAGRSITTRFFVEKDLRHTLEWAGFVDVRIERRASFGLIFARKTSR